MSDINFKDEDLEAMLEFAKEDPEYYTVIDAALLAREDALGHIWDMGWEDSETPHPGFGGSQNIYGGYVDQCIKCGMFGHEYKEQVCDKKVR